MISSETGLGIALALLVAVVLWRLVSNPDVIDNQRELAIRRRAWRGDDGLVPRQREVARLRARFAVCVVFGSTLAAAVIVALLRS